MPALEIHRDAWSSRLTEFTRVHAGWLVSMDLATAAGTRRAIHHLPLAGLSVDRDVHGETAVVVSAGRSTNDHVTHVVAAVRRIYLRKTNDGAEAGLEIQSRDGLTILELRVPALPETVDGIVAACQ